MPADAAVPVPEARLEALYESVVPLQAAEARLWREAYRKRRWREWVQWCVIAVQAAAIWGLAQNQHYIPEFVYLNRGGVQDTATALSELPSDQYVAGIESLVWQYVRHREHYAFSEADESYAIVSAMSAQNVKTQYQKWANPKLNPDAYGNKLGRDGFIRVYRKGGAFLTHSPDYDTGVYQVRFCRMVITAEGAASAQRWAVSVSYQTVDTIPWWERVTVNHAGLIVSQYPGAESEGAGPKAVQSPTGAADPCE